MSLCAKKIKNVYSAIRIIPDFIVPRPINTKALSPGPVIPMVHYHAAPCPLTLLSSMLLGQMLFHHFQIKHTCGQGQPWHCMTLYMYVSHLHDIVCITSTVYMTLYVSHLHVNLLLNSQAMIISSLHKT